MGGGTMICKHCNEEVVKNTVTRSKEPFVYHPFKHKWGNLLGCFDSKGNLLGTTAEPKDA
jgi:hypothetical protein